MLAHTGRSRRVAVATTLAAAFVLALVPPAVSRGVPATVLESTGLEFPPPLDPSVARRAGPGGAAWVARAAWTENRTVCADFNFTAVALTWKQTGDATVPANISWGADEAGLGAIFRTQSDPDHAPDWGTAENARRVGTPPIWTGGGRCIRFNLELPAREEVAGLEAVFINTSGTARGRSILGTIGDAMARMWGMLSADEAAAEAPRPAIIQRAGWGADETLRNCGPEYADRLKMAFVHHTATGNGYTRSQADDVIRSIYAFHTQGRGFCDIAYNFLVDRFGRIYEGRAGGMTSPVIGGHAQGFNTGSTGVALIGEFQTRDPTRASIRALERLLAWRLDVAHLRPTGTATMTSAGGPSQRFEEGEEVRLPVISGHRQTGYTACPGDRLWNRLPAIRTAAEARGLPKIWDARQSVDALEVGLNKVRYRATLSSRLQWSLEVTGPEGEAVRSWSGRGTSVDVRWKGLDPEGFPVPDGTYTATFSARDGPDGPQARPAVLTLPVTAGCTQSAGPEGATLTGTDGNDVLCGGEGNDVLIGGDGADILLGLGGSDHLLGEAGADVLVGGDGADTLEGGAGRDTLFGLAGPDVLAGGEVADVLDGGPGDDSLDGGGGVDLVSFATAEAGVTADLAAGTASGDGSDVLAGLESAEGSRFDDDLSGGAGDESLSGLAGRDVLSGGGGDDLLRGGPGTDTLRGGAGDDELRGGAGRDLADYAAAPARVAVDLGAGTATGDGSDVLRGIHDVRGSSRADILRGDGNANRLDGGAGADLLLGRVGADTLIGGPGRDELRGWRGPDVLLAAGEGRDSLHGGAGTDRGTWDRRDEVRSVERRV